MVSLSEPPPWSGLDTCFSPIRDRFRMALLYSCTEIVAGQPSNHLKKSQEVQPAGPGAVT